MYFDKSQIISWGGVCRGAERGGKGREGKGKAERVLISRVGTLFP